jgi:hypothetical protein
VPPRPGRHSPSMNSRCSRMTPPLLPLLALFPALQLLL